MKHPVRILSLFLACILLYTALPLTAHAEETTFPKAGSARIIAADDGALRAKWEIDYAALPEAYSVTHTLVFYKANNYTSEWNVLTLTAEGRVNELDLTEYKEWYFGDSESRYYFELTTRYAVVNDGRTSATTMNPVTSAKEYLYKAMMNNAALTQATLSPYHEGDSYLYTDVTWTNMQFGYKLRCDISVTGGEEMSYLVTPVFEDAGINGTVKTKTVTEYQTSMSYVAVCCKTGEYGEITLTDEEKALSPIQQNTVVTEKVNAWGAERGFAENSYVMGGYNFGVSTVVADGVTISESEYYSPDFDAALYDHISIVSSPTIYLLFKEPAVWGDVDGDGAATSPSWTRPLSSTGWQE